MGIAIPWRPGDGRSRRADRVPMDMRFLGRILPSLPLKIPDRLHGAMPLRQLSDLLLQATNLLGSHLPELQGQISLSTGHYSELLGVVFGGHARELLVPGAYIVTDSSPARRVMYVGSSVDGYVRARLISHVFERGRVYLSQQAFRGAVASIQEKVSTDEQSIELALRHALFGANRWSVATGIRTQSRVQAAQLVAYGAFDVATVRVAPGHAAVARCIERFLVDAVARRCGEMPPLNDVRVTLDRDLHRGGRIDGAMLRFLSSELDTLVDGIGFEEH